MKLVCKNFQVMKSKSRSRNGSNVERRGIVEDASLNKSSVKVDFGNLIWVQLNGQSWFGQVFENWEYFSLSDILFLYVYITILSCLKQLLVSFLVSSFFSAGC